MRSQVTTSSVNVAVDAKPQEDLSRILDDVRAQYEGAVDKNRREMEAWYKVKVRRRAAHEATKPMKGDSVAS